MNWEEEFEEWYKKSHGWISWGKPPKDFLVGEEIVWKAIDEALTVVPMSEPPLFDGEILEWKAMWKSMRDRKEKPTTPVSTIKELLDMIDWQKAVIAHMAKDNGYQDGYKVGHKEGFEEGHGEGWEECLRKHDINDE